MALGAQNIKAKDIMSFKTELDEVFDTLAATRPTARNLFQVIERMRKAAVGIKNIQVFCQLLSDRCPSTS